MFIALQEKSIDACCVEKLSLLLRSHPSSFLFFPPILHESHY